MPVIVCAVAIVLVARDVAETGKRRSKMVQRVRVACVRMVVLAAALIAGQSGIIYCLSRQNCPILKLTSAVDHDDGPFSGSAC